MNKMLHHSITVYAINGKLNAKTVNINVAQLESTVTIPGPQVFVHAVWKVL